MRKLLFLLLLCSFSAFAQEDTGDVHLIEPIKETEAMNLSQARNLIQQYRNWGVKRLRLDSIMKNYKGEGAKVCICDTGEPTHIELRGKVKASKNFTNDAKVEDGNGHATHVAGIIDEIAPRADLYFAKVLSNSGSGTSRGVASGLDWCIDQGANIINLSLGSRSPSTSIKNAVDRAISKGALVVAAVGNDGRFQDDDIIGYPAKYEETLAIGSINDQIVVSKFSSAGPEGDVVAPGEKILSTWLNNKYIVLSGTSMATPYASGVAALFYEKYGTHKHAEQFFENFAQDIAPKGFDRRAFWGHVEPVELFSADTLIIEEPTPPDDGDTTPPMVGGFLWWELLIVVGIAILGIIAFIIFRKS